MDKTLLLDTLGSWADHRLGTLSEEERLRSLSNDDRRLVFKVDYALCERRWCYDDWNSDEDWGNSSAKIPRAEVESFLDEVVTQGGGERVFDSVNSWHSHARDDYGRDEVLVGTDYAGKALLKISVQEGKVQFRFLPTPPQVPTVRLDSALDYLNPDKLRTPLPQ